jgi:hypothetical protein
VSSTEDVYTRLREIILSGEISPNAVLSQVRLARSALTVLGKIDPRHQPVAITAALAQVRRADAAPA